jgi:hypothetical protein
MDSWESTPALIQLSIVTSQSGSEHGPLTSDSTGGGSEEVETIDIVELLVVKEEYGGILVEKYDEVSMLGEGDDGIGGAMLEVAGGSTEELLVEVVVAIEVRLVDVIEDREEVLWDVLEGTTVVLSELTEDTEEVLVRVVCGKEDMLVKVADDEGELMVVKLGPEVKVGSIVSNTTSPSNPP